MKSGRYGDTEDQENSSDRSGDSATNSAGDHHHKVTTSSPKRSRKALQRKVVSIPIKDLESSSSSRNKGEAAPPSDSWTWRKYGQKPIKGSPYPRGYYRCSSSKGCPARKQVERSRVDPTMLVVTYSSDHNHQWPQSSRNHHRHSPNSSKSSSPIAAVYGGDDDGVGVSPVKSEIHEAVDTKTITANDEKKFTSLNVAATDDFNGWFADMGCGTMLESPMLAETSSNDTDVSMLFPIMGEEEEYLFADLGELPECSVVFRRREVSTAVGGSGTQWCGTTS